MEGSARPRLLVERWCAGTRWRENSNEENRCLIPKTSTKPLIAGCSSHDLFAGSFDSSRTTDGRGESWAGGGRSGCQKTARTKASGWKASSSLPRSRTSSKWRDWSITTWRLLKWKSIQRTTSWPTDRFGRTFCSIFCVMKSMIQKISETQVRICCGGNCSLMTYQDGMIVINDELGGQIKIPLVEALEISEAAKQLNGWFLKRSIFCYWSMLYFEVWDNPQMAARSSFAVFFF